MDSPNMKDESDSQQLESRLHEAIVEYIDQVDAGSTPNIDEFLGRYPEIRAELERFIYSRGQMERMAGSARISNSSSELSRRSSESNKAVMPASPFVLPKPTSEGLGQLGEYRLIREIGRGGMGVVYEAEQLSLRRMVALKILPFASAIDSRRLQRFKNEALAAASLLHDNIVPVYGVGSDLGVHFYAMQLIQGQSLATLIGQLGRSSIPGYSRHGDSTHELNAAGDTLPTDSRYDSENDRSVREYTSKVVQERADGRLKHFKWIASIGRLTASALEHAHQSGVIHRDIKPANLLLDTTGKLWVTDFGLAQIGLDTGLTVTGEPLGTLRYSSPEQARILPGIVDHRTDIYSLGATLYELLTLHPLFDGSDRNLLMRQVGVDNPIPLRTHCPAIPEELETIVLKAVAKEPSERYQTAFEMAEDLRRFEEDRPILARRPAMLERLRKIIRRHSVVVAATMVVFVLLAVASLSSTLLIRAAYTRERARAEEALEHFKIARRSVDELFRVSEEELADRPGTERLRNRLLKSVLAYYIEFNDRASSDPSTQLYLQEAKKRVEQIISDLAVQRAANDLRLLAQPSVLEDLVVTTEQTKSIAKLNLKMRDQTIKVLASLGKSTVSERSKSIVSQARSNEAELRGILSSQQLQRLHQIALQENPGDVFKEPEFAATFQFSSLQREQLRMIEERDLLEKIQVFLPKALVDRELQVSTDRRPVSKRLVDVLTKKQFEIWLEMTGKPFDVERLVPDNMLPQPQDPESTPE